MNEDNFKQTRTELHTHLMGMLSAEEFLKLLALYSDSIYWPINKAEKDTSEYINTSYLVGNKDAIEAISIPLGKRLPYEEGLGSLYRNRSELLKSVVRRYSITHSIDINEAQYIVFNDYFNRCLKELIQNGVKYTEISFANDDIISHLKPDEELTSQIKYRFLLCTQRINKMSPSLQRKVERACENGVAIGFDFMGMETPIGDDELSKTDSKSWYKKLDSTIKVLKGHKDSVLRIHSGEAKGTKENSEKIFRVLDEIKKDNNYKDFPPPELRIGHGVHYIKNDYYYEFLRKNNVIVEINATSNMALSNINSIDELPYIDYLEHGIKIALSTDGHGAYSTNTILEDKIAYLEYLKSKMPKEYNKLVDWENEYIEKKVNR